MANWRRQDRGSTISTHFLRVPIVDWPRLTQGRKHELRLDGRGMAAGRDIKPPTPIVIYAMGHHQPYRTRLMVCEGVRVEPLGAISPAAVRDEGFETLREFRAYWRKRHRHGLWKPLEMVRVYTLRTWQPGDERRFADELLRRLYGRWVDG